MARFSVQPLSLLRRKVKDFDLRLLETSQGPLSCECGAEMLFERQDAVFESEGSEIKVTGVPCYRCLRCGKTIWNGLIEVRCAELAWLAKRRRLKEIRFYMMRTWRRRGLRLTRNPFDALAEDAVRQYRRGETVSLRKLAEEGIQKDPEPIPAETPDGMVHMRLRALQERLKNSPEYQADMEELHRIRAEIWRSEQGLSLDERIEKTRRESQEIIDKYGLKVLPPGPNEKKEAKRLIRALKRWNRR